MFLPDSHRWLRPPDIDPFSRPAAAAVLQAPAGHVRRCRRRPFRVSTLSLPRRRSETTVRAAQAVAGLMLNAAIALHSTLFVQTCVLRFMQYEPSQPFPRHAPSGMPCVGTARRHFPSHTVTFPSHTPSGVGTARGQAGHQQSGGGWGAPGRPGH